VKIKGTNIENSKRKGDKAKNTHQQKKERQKGKKAKKFLGRVGALEKSEWVYCRKREMEPVRRKQTARKARTHEMTWSRRNSPKCPYLSITVVMRGKGLLFDYKKIKRGGEEWTER